MAKQRLSIAAIAISLTTALAFTMVAIHHFYTQNRLLRRHRQSGVVLPAENKALLDELARKLVSNEKHIVNSNGHTADPALVRPELPVVPPYLSLRERMGVDSGTIFRDSSDGVPGVMKWRTLSPEKPRAHYIEDFWAPGEAEVVIKMAEGNIQRSTVVGANAGLTSNVRTSRGTFLSSYEQSSHPIIKAARARVSLLSGLPIENVEATQILKYDAGQRYVAHPDYFQTQYKEHLARGGQRVASFLSWLCNTTSGGETEFPRSMNPNTNSPYIVSPKKNDGVLFYNCGRVCIIIYLFFYLPSANKGGVIKINEK